MKRAMSAPPTGCRFESAHTCVGCAEGRGFRDPLECWECGIPVGSWPDHRYFECILCIDCWNLRGQRTR